MRIASWLFVRGSESIWIERPFGNTLIIAGPGHRRYRRTFFTEDQLQQFQMRLAETLAEQRWFLWAYNDDRRKTHRTDVQMPAGGDRRLTRAKRSPVRAAAPSD
jgi:hypothetical protein